MNIINFLPQSDYDALAGELKAAGYHILEMDTTGISEFSTVYRKLIEVLPIGIPLGGNVNWDAFQDAVWEGITLQQQRCIALLWSGSEDLLSSSLFHFFSIIDNLKTLAVSVYNDASVRYTLVIFVLGDSPCYS